MAAGKVGDGGDSEHRHDSGGRPQPATERPAGDRLELRVADRRPHLSGIDLVPTGGEGGQQRLVGEDVDAPRQPLGAAADELDGTAAEEIGATVTGGAQPEHQVGGDIAAVQRLEAEAVCDAVVELPHGALVQPLIEFRLAEEDDLQQLVAAGFEVGEQADLFEGVRRHRVRFVDEDDDLPAGGVDLEQTVLQRPQQQLSLPCRQVEAQFGGDGVQDLVA